MFNYMEMAFRVKENCIENAGFTIRTCILLRCAVCSLVPRLSSFVVHWFTFSIQWNLSKVDTIGTMHAQNMEASVIQELPDSSGRHGNVYSGC